MKFYSFLPVLFLICLSAKAQAEFLTPTNEDALSALEEALPVLNKYNLITNGEEWFLAEQDAVSAVIEHNRTAPVKQKIISEISYYRNYRLILGLPPEPHTVYGDKWFDMKEEIAHAFLRDGIPAQKIKTRGNKVLRSGQWRFLTTQEAVSAVNDYNPTALPQKKIISIRSYTQNYTQVPGLPSHLYDGGYWYYPQRKRLVSQIIGWIDYDHKTPKGNKVLRGGQWRFLTDQEAVPAINKHNQTASQQEKIISGASYDRNYRLVPGLPSHVPDCLKNGRQFQITGWTGHSSIDGPRGNRVLADGKWRFLTDQEAVSAVNEHNRTAPQKDKIISTTSFLQNYRLIPGLHSHTVYYLTSIKSQVIGWADHNGNREGGPHGNKVLTNGQRRFLTDQEAVSAVNEHNRTASQQDKIISGASYERNYRLIPGLPHFNGLKNGEFLDRIAFQIIGWHGPTPRVNRGITAAEHLSFLTDQEAVSAVKEHNRRTAKIEKKIISAMSYEENYGLIPGLPPSPWIHYGLNRWKMMLEDIYSDHHANRSRCKALMFKAP